MAFNFDDDFNEREEQEDSDQQVLLNLLKTIQNLEKHIAWRSSLKPLKKHLASCSCRRCEMITLEEQLRARYGEKLNLPRIG